MRTHSIRLNVPTRLDVDIGARILEAVAHARLRGEMDDDVRRAPRRTARVERRHILELRDRVRESRWCARESRGAFPSAHGRNSGVMRVEAVDEMAVARAGAAQRWKPMKPAEPVTKKRMRRVRSRRAAACVACRGKGRGLSTRGLAARAPASLVDVTICAKGPNWA